MTKGLKRKFLTMIRAAVEAKNYFTGGVKTIVPTWPLPAQTQVPSAFVYWLPSKLDYLTTHEKRAQHEFAILGFVRAEADLELIKADCADEIEEAIEDLLVDASFRAIGVQVRMTAADPGPLALIDLGYRAGVYPPFGAVRMEGAVEYDYQARTT